MNFRLGELFCGPGGIGLGAAQASFTCNNEKFSISHEWANDYDKDTCKTYKHNVAGKAGRVIHKDIRKLDIDALPKIDALAFGFPCNDFSVVGEQKGMNGVYGPLYRYCVHVLEKLTPQWFLAENVGGLRNSNEGTAFQKILKDLHGAGYRIYPHLYKFENYGIPQARHRIIIIGIRADLPFEFKVPVVNVPMISARQAIEEPKIRKNALNHEKSYPSATVAERLKHISPGENAFTANLPCHLSLNNLVNGLNKAA